MLNVRGINKVKKQVEVAKFHSTYNFNLFKSLGNKGKEERLGFPLS